MPITPTTDSASPSTPEHRLRVITAGICALILTVGLARFAYTPLLPVMRKEAGLSTLAGGWLATVNYAGYMLGALIAASLSSFERKFVLYRWGLGVAVLTTVAMGCTHNVVVWGILRFLSGLSSTAGLLLASGLVLNWLIRNGSPPKLGLHFIGLGLGLALSGVCAEAMAGRLPWNGQWIALGLIGLVFFLPAWFWMPAPRRLSSDHPSLALPPPARRWMAILNASYFCAGFGYVITATFLVAILDRLPSLAPLGNWLWVIVGVAAVPSSFMWDRIGHAIGNIRALILAYGVQVVSIALPALSGGLVANLAAAILYGGTFAGIVSLTLALVGRFFPQNPAKAMARLTLSYGVAQIVAPAIAGIMARASGDYRGALWVAAAMMIIGIVLLTLLRRDAPIEAHAVDRPEPTVGPAPTLGVRC